MKIAKKYFKNKLLLIASLLLITISVSSQSYRKKTKWLFGTFHTQNTTINGISVGAFPQFNNKKRFVRTNGIRLEVPGIGLLGFMANGSLLPYGKTQEIVNGINLSGGTLGAIEYNGITLGFVTQSGNLNNGIAIAGMINSINDSNGIQATFLLNESENMNGLQLAIGNTTNYLNGLQIGGSNNVDYAMNGLQVGIANFSDGKMTGIQIGLFNRNYNSKGIQIGLWNVNEKRKLPIINWNFKSRTNRKNSKLKEIKHSKNYKKINLIGTYVLKDTIITVDETLDSFDIKFKNKVKTYLIRFNEDATVQLSKTTDVEVTNDNLLNFLNPNTSYYYYFKGKNKLVIESKDGNTLAYRKMTFEIKGDTLINRKTRKIYILNEKLTNNHKILKTEF